MIRSDGADPSHSAPVADPFVPLSSAADGKSATEKEVYFVRHGHSTYNEWRDQSFRFCRCPPCSGCCIGDPLLFDAGLSMTGQAQVATLPTVMRAAGLDATMELAVCSPLSRSIQTALGAFEARDRSENTLPVQLIACGLITEVLDTACDIGLPVPALEARYPEIAWGESVGFDVAGQVSAAAAAPCATTSTNVQ
eukprot:SAG31_NODE_7124_length_1782_cov_2.603684_2_plen_195_part_00